MALRKKNQLQEKIVDPWELTRMKQFTIQERNRRGRKDFDSLNVDYDTVSSLDLARESKKSGQSFTNEQADLYLERN
jgi:hypothetical protein